MQGNGEPRVDREFDRHRGEFAGHAGREVAVAPVLEAKDELAGGPGVFEGGADAGEVAQVKTAGAVGWFIPGGGAEGAAAGAPRGDETFAAAGAQRGIECPAADATEGVEEVAGAAGEVHEAGQRHGGRIRERLPGRGYNGGMGTVTVLLFASLAERAGVRRLELPVGEGETVGSIRDRLLERFPGLAAAVPTLMYALDETYVREEAAVRPGSTLALIPPVSGG